MVEQCGQKSEDRRAGPSDGFDAYGPSGLAAPVDGVAHCNGPRALLYVHKWAFVPLDAVEEVRDADSLGPS